MSGVPGSGKSYFSRLLREKKSSHVYIISSDALRDAILGNQQNLTQDSLMWKMYYRLAEVYSEDPEGIVILDATFTTKKLRVNAVEVLKSYFESIDLVTFSLPLDVIKKQNLEREWPIPTEAVERLYAKFETPDKEELALYKNYFVIDRTNLEDIVNMY